jgi:hypothetical protein
MGIKGGQRAWLPLWNFTIGSLGTSWESFKPTRTQSKMHDSGPLVDGLWLAAGGLETRIGFIVLKQCYVFDETGTLWKWVNGNFWERITP